MRGGLVSDIILKLKLEIAGQVDRSDDPYRETGLMLGSFWARGRFLSVPVVRNITVTMRHCVQPCAYNRSGSYS